MGLIIRLAKLFDGLGSSRKYVLEQPPMGGTTNETLTQDYKGRKVGDGIWREMVKLGTEVIHDALEERMLFCLNEDV